MHRVYQPVRRVATQNIATLLQNRSQECYSCVTACTFAEPRGISLPDLFAFFFPPTKRRPPACAGDFGEASVSDGSALCRWLDMVEAVGDALYASLTTTRAVLPANSTPP